MKRIIILLLLACNTFISYAQSDITTDTFKVEGNCNMCKKRIENAAFVKGVKRAEWNKDTHQLVVTYKTSKTTRETILQSVAKAGHSSETIAAAEADYKKLPECCHYKTNSCNH